MRSVETTCSRGFRDRGGLFLNLLAEGPIGQITCPAQSAFGKGDRPGPTVRTPKASALWSTRSVGTRVRCGRSPWPRTSTIGRARPTARGASADRSDEGLAASTLEQRLAAIKCYHESEGRASPTDHLQVSGVMQGIRNDSDRREALPRVEAAPLVSSDLRQALEVLPGEGTTPFTTPGRSSPRAGCTRMAPVRSAARAMRESTGALLLAEGPSAEGLSTGALDAVHTSPRWR